MGQFSWITQDTNEPIRESFGCSDETLTTSYMHDDKGNVWEEKTYEGYGVFGGKDFYELLAEMNGASVSEEEIKKYMARGSNPNRDESYTNLMRSKGINIAFNEDDLGNQGKQPNLTRNKDWVWVDKVPKSDPNQGWGEVEYDEDIW